MKPHYRVSLTVGLESSTAASAGCYQNPAWHLELLQGLAERPRLVGKLEGYTISRHDGYWRGTREHSATLSTLVDGTGVQDITDVVRAIAREYNEISRQDASIITGERIQAEFVT